MTAATEAAEVRNFLRELLMLSSLIPARRAPVRSAKERFSVGAPLELMVQLVDLQQHFTSGELDTSMRKSALVFVCVASAAVGCISMETKTLR